MPVEREYSGKTPLVLRFRPKRVLLTVIGVCVSAELLLVFLDATVNYSKWTELSMIRRLFNITREDGLASWFGVTQTFLVALTLLLIFLVSRRDGSKRWVVGGWLALTLIFGYMAMDDGAKIHERVGSAYKRVHIDEARAPEPGTVGGRAIKTFPSYSWQIVFAPPFAAMGVFVIVFLMTQLRDPWPRILVVAAIGCLGLAVAFDFVEGLNPDHEWNLYTRIAERWDMESFTEETFDENPYDSLRHFSKSVEEFIEMFAMTLLWAVFLSHFMKKARKLQIEFVDVSP